MSPESQCFVYSGMVPQGFLRFLLLLGAVPIGAQVLTLDQAVQEALSKGSEQVVWAAGLASSRAAEAAARARAGLTVSTNLGYSASETRSDPSKASDDTLPHNGSAGLTIGTPLTSLSVKGTRKLATTGGDTIVLGDEASLSFSQALWNGYWGGSAQAAADKAAQSLRTAELNAQVAHNRLILTVKQAYFTLLSAQEAVGQLTQTQKQRQDSLRFAQTKQQLGQATTLDLKQAQINARTADLDLEAGRSALEVARRRLANLVGRPESEPLWVAAEPDPAIPAATLEAAVEAALRQRIEPLVAQATIRSAQIDEATAFGASTPSVTLSGGLTYTKTQSPKNEGALVGNVSVSVGAPLIDAGLSGAQRAQAQAQRTVAETQYQQTLKSIPVDVAEAWNNWQVARGRLEVAALSVEVAEGQRLVVQAQFDAGLKTLADIQTSDTALSTAQLNLLKAKITAQLSALTLQSQMGQ